MKNQERLPFKHLPDIRKVHLYAMFVFIGLLTQVLKFACCVEFLNRWKGQINPNTDAQVLETYYLNLEADCRSVSHIPCIWIAHSLRDRCDVKVLG